MSESRDTSRSLHGIGPISPDSLDYYLISVDADEMKRNPDAARQWTQWFEGRRIERVPSSAYSQWRESKRRLVGRTTNIVEILDSGGRPHEVTVVLDHYGGADEHSTTIAAREVKRAGDILDAWSAFLPVRVVSEDLGDYLEDIAYLFEQGERWKPRLRLIAAICATAKNAIVYKVKELIERRKAG